MTILRLNDRNGDVRKLQLLLNSRVSPSPNLRLDGHFGPHTAQAVRDFQTSKGLVADGIVGPKTLLSLGLKHVLAPTAPVISPLAPWMDIAIAELGVHEDSLPGQHNARIVEYHQATTLKATDDETPWCSSFVNWVLVKAGKQGTASASAKSWLSWGREITTPSPGAITVIKKKTAGYSKATGSASGFHVAFFISMTPTHIRLLGGNQHDQVKYSNFDLSTYEVRGFRLP